MQITFSYDLENWHILGKADVEFGHPAETDEYGRPTECDTDTTVYLIEAWLGSCRLDIDKLPATLRRALKDCALEAAETKAELLHDLTAEMV